MARNTEEEMLRQTYELARENNKMLRKMRRNAFFGWIIKLLVWAVILGVPVYLYFTVLQPVFSDVQQTYQGIQESTQQVQDVGTQVQTMQIPESFKTLLQSFGIQVE